MDTVAGPYQNHTVVFLGSEKGLILKFLARIGNSGFLNDSLFLEEMSVYNPEKYVEYLVLSWQLLRLFRGSQGRHRFYAFLGMAFKIICENLLIHKRHYFLLANNVCIYIVTHIDVCVYIYTCTRIYFTYT